MLEVNSVTYGTMYINPNNIVSVYIDLRGNGQLVTCILTNAGIMYEVTDDGLDLIRRLENAE